MPSIIIALQDVASPTDATLTGSSRCPAKITKVKLLMKESMFVTMVGTASLMKVLVIVQVEGAKALGSKKPSSGWLLTSVEP
eukprot:CAMPEP_0185588904 /NCGR_PEP_ID=MMETSP0434-20130131/54934_1 /TAXON_ID=626734 ORGANISM="Favella taraikaensis, Strain Fe Narragansett Bay" /NCGR_SAMPLE_ID=MMETSP0434 /ASSEMBLY_ACC=CAM_ASM_000379 /LENGTH=81 /DNA_ID=CAMNT_0028211885 /DNA_START=1202 /DNA_END=1443 /DNA_ORIENTATION=+